MYWDSFGDIFDTVTDVAVKVAPYAIPAAGAFGLTKLLGGTTDEAWISAGVAGGTAGFLKNSGGGDTGALGKAGISSGAISGTGAVTPAATAAASGGQTIPGSAVRPGAGATQGGILDGLGITGSDLLKLGGQVLSGLDDTDDEFRKRQLDIQDRNTRVDGVSWSPKTVQRTNNQQDITKRRVI